MQPSQGRVVHYKEMDATFAAKVVLVNEDGTVNLAVYAHDGTTIVGRQNVQQGDDDLQWQWPPRV